jgi:hypothetical protein
VWTTSPVTLAHRSFFALEGTSAPAASVHFDTDVWQSGDIALTFTCLGIDEMSSNRLVGNSWPAYQ